MPRIYYLHPRNAASPPDWRLHAATAARLGFDHLCAGPIFAPAGGDPFLISDLGATDPRIGHCRIARKCGARDRRALQRAAVCGCFSTSCSTGWRQTVPARARPAASMRATTLAASSIPARILRPGRLRLCGRMPSTGSCRGGRSVSPAWCGQEPRDFGLSAWIRSRAKPCRRSSARPAARHPVVSGPGRRG